MTKNQNSVYFLGIGGIGMSALARFFLQQGWAVHGYDRTNTPLTTTLMEEGMHIHFEDDIAKIPAETCLAIYTPAIPAENKELAYLKDSNIPLKKRSEALADISNGLFNIAVGGTHGKTTITSLIAHIMYTAKADFRAFVGGILSNYQSNYIAHGQAQKCVVEADEFDKSFLRLHPDVAVISSMDADHLDIYSNHDHLKETFNAFAGNLKEGGKLILNEKLTSGIDHQSISYGLKSSSTYHARDIEVWYHRFHFNLYKKNEKLFTTSLAIPGKHNIENAVAAAAACIESGIEPKDVAIAFETFKGIKRRFEFIVETKEMVYIDDYAHHPEEIRACLNAVKELYPYNDITVVFQPHLFSRTRDFLREFARSLEIADEVILLDIYPAREKPIEGINSELLLEVMVHRNKRLLTKKGAISYIKKKYPEVLLTLGAGDIDQLVPVLKEMFE